MQHVGKIKGRWAAQAAAQQAAARRSVTLNDIAGGTVALPSSYGMTGSRSAPSLAGSEQQIKKLDVPFADYFVRGAWPGETTVIESWNGRKEIDSGEWQILLARVRFDANQTPKWWIPVRATYFDTPFYNRGELSGIGCFNGRENCYDRSQINYVAEGELWAALGVSKETGHSIVFVWKNKQCVVVGIFVCSIKEVDPKVYEMFDEGFDDYNQFYPPPVP